MKNFHKAVIDITFQGFNREEKKLTRKQIRVVAFSKSPKKAIAEAKRKWNKAYFENYFEVTSRDIFCQIHGVDSEQVTKPNGETSFFRMIPYNGYYDEDEIA